MPKRGKKLLEKGDRMPRREKTSRERQKDARSWTIADAKEKFQLFEPKKSPEMTKIGLKLDTSQKLEKNPSKICQTCENSLDFFRKGRIRPKRRLKNALYEDIF